MVAGVPHAVSPVQVERVLQAPASGRLELLASHIQPRLFAPSEHSLARRDKPGPASRRPPLSALPRDVETEGSVCRAAIVVHAGQDRDESVHVVMDHDAGFFGSGP